MAKFETRYKTLYRVKNGKVERIFIEKIYSSPFFTKVTDMRTGKIVIRDYGVDEYLGLLLSNSDWELGYPGYCTFINEFQETPPIVEQKRHLPKGMKLNDKMLPAIKQEIKEKMYETRQKAGIPPWVELYPQVLRGIARKAFKRIVYSNIYNHSDFVVMVDPESEYYETKAAIKPTYFDYEALLPMFIKALLQLHGVRVRFVTKTGVRLDYVTKGLTAWDDINPEYNSIIKKLYKLETEDIFLTAIVRDEDTIDYMENLRQRYMLDRSYEYSATKVYKSIEYKGFRTVIREVDVEMHKFYAYMGWLDELERVDEDKLQETIKDLNYIIKTLYMDGKVDEAIKEFELLEDILSTESREYSDSKNTGYREDLVVDERQLEFSLEELEEDDYLGIDPLDYVIMKGL